MLRGDNVIIIIITTTMVLIPLLFYVGYLSQTLSLPLFAPLWKCLIWHLSPALWHGLPQHGWLSISYHMCAVWTGPKLLRQTDILHPTLISKHRLSSDVVHRLIMQQLAGGLSATKQHLIATPNMWWMCSRYWRRLHIPLWLEVSPECRGSSRSIVEAMMLMMTRMKFANNNWKCHWFDFILFLFFVLLLRFHLKNGN